MNFRKSIRIDIILILIFCTLILMLAVIVHPESRVDASQKDLIEMTANKAKNLNSAINYMNDYEKHYDATGPLILIDLNNDLVGIYDKDNPLKFFIQKFDIDYNHVSTDLKNLKNYYIELDEKIESYLISYSVETPVIVDRYLV